jgi:hypothetical protein
MSKSIIDRYYKPHQKLNEPLNKTIERVNNDYIEKEFRWQCDRDIIIFSKEYINGYKKLDNTTGNKRNCLQNLSS